MGVDSHDLQAASENGIIVTNMPVYSPETIAEFVVAGADNGCSPFAINYDGC